MTEVNPTTYDVSFAAGNPAGSYTLFVKGDQVDAANGLALAAPGQLVVANSGSGSNAVSTVSAPDGFNAGTPTTLGATQTYAIGASSNGSTPNPVAAVVADFNNDGIPDLAIVSTLTVGFGGSEIEIYTGNTTGGFNATPATTVALPLNAFTPVAIVAYNPSTTGATGFSDLAVLDSFNEVDVFTNTGTPGAVPTFNPAVVDPTGAGNAVALTAGDFNGDGVTDLAVLDAAAGGGGNFNIDFLAGQGNGTFGAATALAIGNTATPNTTIQNPTSIASGSLQTATSEDLAVGGSNGVETVLNTGTNNTVGTFSFKIGALYNSTTKAGLLNSVTSVAIGHLNANGAGTPEDIAAASSAAGSTSVEALINEDTGTGAINPVTSTTFSLLGSAPAGTPYVANALALAPQTPGGPAAIVVATSALNQVTVLGNTSTTATPMFAAAVHYTVDLNPVGLAIGDLNGDTNSDIVTVNDVDPNGTTGGTFSVLRNNDAGTGTYGAPTVLNPSASQPDSVVVGDLNGDGIPDLVVANKTANTVTVYLANNSDAGTYVAHTYSIKDVAGNGSTPVSVTLANLNGAVDGNGNPILDIITANSGDNTVSILLGNGDGTFQKATTVAVGDDPTQVVAGVFTPSTTPGKAGNVSLAVAHNGGGASTLNRGVTLLLGNGDGTFQPAEEILPGVEATALVAADFTEANGMPEDLAVANATNGTVDLLRNNGQGVLTHATSDTYSVGADPSALAVGDFNLDGFQDLVAVSSSTSGANQQIAVLLNSGGGGFAAAAYTPLPFNFPINSVAVTNLNGDDYPDLVVGLTGASANTTGAGNPFGTNTTAAADANLYSLIGNGDGTFSSPVPYMTGAKGNNTVVAVASDPLVLRHDLYLGHQHRRCESGQEWQL